MTELARADGSTRTHVPHGELDGNLPPAAQWSMRSASTTAGVALLLMSGLAAFGSVFTVDRLVTVGDAARTVNDIAASAGAFRLGVASLVVVVALDVVVAWALYRVFSPVSQAVSMLAAAFRIVYSGVFLVAIGELLGVVRVVGNDGSLGALSADAVELQTMLGIAAFNDLWYVAQFLFGLHLLLVGCLAYRSGYLPRALGVLVAIAGAGYAADSLGTALSPRSWTDVSSVTFVGEFLLALWLAIGARRLALTARTLAQ